MHYRVHAAGEGRFEIQRLEPVTIGVMYDEALADLVLAILETDDDAIFRAKAKIDDVNAPRPTSPPRCLKSGIPVCTRSVESSLSALRLRRSSPKPRPDLCPRR